MVDVDDDVDLDSSVELDGSEAIRRRLTPPSTSTSTSDRSAWTPPVPRGSTARSRVGSDVYVAVDVKGGVKVHVHVHVYVQGVDDGANAGASIAAASDGGIAHTARQAFV
jgi:hypothetical protein